MILFSSDDPTAPAKFYMASAPAHCSYETRLLRLANAAKKPCGDAAASNKRGINHFLHPDVPKTCQFSMGMTILAPGSMWNSMPTHTHERRMEVYMHFPHLRAAHGREVRGAVRMMFAQTANCKGCAFDHANIGPAKKKTKLTL